jgi:hypothetical protein
MKRLIKAGQVDYTALVYVPDPASTDGSGKTGLAHTDMTVSFVRVETDNDVTVTDVTSSLAAITNLTDAHSDWGWKEVSSTLAPGLYRLDLADAVVATGAWTAVVYVMITTSAAAASPMEFVISTKLIDDLQDITAANVNSEVVDALATDTYAEPGQGAPAATATLAAKINYLYKAWRNKVTQTSTTYSLFADDASTVDQKATVSDDGTTFTRTEIATGP